MSLHVCILGIDGSGKSTVVNGLPDMLAGRAGVRVASIGDSHRVSDPEQTILSPGFRPGGVPLTARVANGFKRVAKRYTNNLRLYPFFKALQLMFQDATAKKLDVLYQPDVVVSDGNLILSVLGRSVNYLRPARTESEPWDVDLTSVRDALSGLDNNVTTRNWIGLLTRFKRILKRCGFDILWLPDVVVFLDVDPMTAMNRIHDRGAQVDPHENPTDLTRAREMYTKILQALTTCRKKANLMSVPVDHRTPGEVVRLVSEMVQQRIDGNPYRVPSLGGSLPLAEFTQLPDATIILVPYGQHDENNHSPNECFAVDHFFNGARTMVALLSEMID